MNFLTSRVKPSYFPMRPDTAEEFLLTVFSETGKFDALILAQNILLN